MSTINDDVITCYSEYLRWREEYGTEHRAYADSVSTFSPETEEFSTKDVEHYPGLLELMVQHKNGAFPRNCLYCNSSLNLKSVILPSNPVYDFGFGAQEHTANQLLCPSCRWWCIYETIETNPQSSLNFFHETNIYEGILRRFSLTDRNIPLEVLRNYIRDNYEKIHIIDPRAFERLVASIYKDFYNCEVRHVGGPGDNGVDVFAVISDKPHLIQTKRRGHKHRSESVSTVRELIGTLITQNVQHGHIVTTAETFSIAAKGLANNEYLKRYCIEISLLSKADLFSMLNLTSTKAHDVWDSILEKEI